LRRTWPAAHRVGIVCGPGNNGGDGYVLARLVHEAGMEVELMHVDQLDRLRGDAKTALEALPRPGSQLRPFHSGTAGACEVLVDALLGTGLDRSVSGEYFEVIDQINGSGVPVLAIDIPSGLNADTGAVMGAAIQAQATMTFIGLKQGLFTGEGPQRCGAVHFDDLAVPAEIYAAVEPAAVRLELTDLKDLLAPRERTGHKGQYGHVLVIGGDAGYTGAARLAAEAAGRIGAGLISVATRAMHAAFLPLARPELMSCGVESPQDLDPLLQRATAIAIGPGLGQAAWGQALWNHVMAQDKPLVVDADALNLLAENPISRPNWVLTPHPGEAARLLGVSTAEVQADRFAAVANLQERYGGVVVLKGAGSLIQGPSGGTSVCTAGNPGMGSGGMGDVLTGVIAGLIAQGLGPPEAARLGVCLHAEAGDHAARDEGERGLLAADLMPWLRRLANL
jgi:NAD(P)H-hydrate epimerase